MDLPQEERHKQEEGEGKVATKQTQKVFGWLQILSLLFIFIVGVAPIFLSYVGESNESFSIYNNGDEGLSFFRNELELEKTGSGTSKYNVTNIVSNLNALNRFNGSGVLMVIGPSAPYDETEFFSLLLFLLRGGSLVIADDFGTGNQILEPLFRAFESYDNMVKTLNETSGVQLPTFNEMLTNFTSGSSTAEDETNALNGQLTGGQSIPGVDLGSGTSSIANGLFNLIGNVLKRFGFNGSVLMDVENNNQNPNRPIIVDVDETNTPYKITEGVSKLQTEMATIISLQLNVSQEITDPVTGETKEVAKTVWQPLSRISLSQITGGSLGQSAPELDQFSQLDFLFPLYSSKQSWIETDIKGAADNTAQPDPEEWGNEAFSLALTLPIFPGGGKIVFIADPSIFINRWTQKVNENDNLRFAMNVVQMTTKHLEDSGKPIPVIFDFGHTYQGLTSPALYSTALLKIIANLSMFPLVAPFVPMTVYSFGRLLIPQSRRLRPILLTKRRGEKGVSEFEKKLMDIKESGAYGEPIKHLLNKIVRTVQADQRFTGRFARDPNELADFFVTNFPGAFNRRELVRSLKSIIRFAEHPTRRMTIVQAKLHLSLLTRMLSYIT